MKKRNKRFLIIGMILIFLSITIYYIIVIHNANGVGVLPYFSAEDAMSNFPNKSKSIFQYKDTNFFCKANESGLFFTVKKSLFSWVKNDRNTTNSDFVSLTTSNQKNLYIYGVLTGKNAKSVKIVGRFVPEIRSVSSIVIPEQNDYDLQKIYFVFKIDTTAGTFPLDASIYLFDQNDCVISTDVWENKSYVFHSKNGNKKVAPNDADYENLDAVFSCAIHSIRNQQTIKPYSDVALHDVTNVSIECNSSTKYSIYQEKSKYYIMKYFEKISLERYGDKIYYNETKKFDRFHLPPISNSVFYEVEPNKEIENLFNHKLFK